MRSAKYAMRAAGIMVVAGLAWAAANASAAGISTTPTSPKKTAPRLAGDVNQDCRVDNADLQAVLARWGAKAGESRYRLRVDLDGDGRIGDGDLHIVLSNWAADCP